LTTAATFFEALGDKANLALTLSNISQARLSLGMVNEAQSAAERSLALAYETGHPLATVSANHRLGAVSLFRGEDELASQYLHQALQAARTADMSRNVAALEVEVAAFHFRLRQFDPARKHAGRASALAKELEDKTTLCMASSYLGALTAAGGLLHAGTNQLRQQLVKAGEIGDKNLTLQVQQLLGEILFEFGKDSDRDEGRTLLLDALAQATLSRQAPDIKRLQAILSSSPN
jgi:tetratricopeptide (TPR) repeat protein